jgi:hypothetical protein
MNNKIVAVIAALAGVALIFLILNAIYIGEPEITIQERGY